MRSIKLNEEEIQVLESMELATISRPLRDRIQSLLMSNKGAKVKELALYFAVTTKTIFIWFNLWESGGCAGILHKSGTGRKAKLKDISVQIIENIVKSHARSLKGAVAEIFSNHGVKISVKTLERYIKKNKIHLA
jgi:transposase